MTGNAPSGGRKQWEKSERVIRTYILASNAKKFSTLMKSKLQLHTYTWHEQLVGTTVSRVRKHFF